MQIKTIEINRINLVVAQAIMATFNRCLNLLTKWLSKTGTPTV